MCVVVPSPLKRSRLSCRTSEINSKFASLRTELTKVDIIHLGNVGLRGDEDDLSPAKHKLRIDDLIPGLFSVFADKYGYLVSAWVNGCVQAGCCVTDIYIWHRSGLPAGVG